MKKLSKKLKLAKETLRNLESESLENVLGAATLANSVCRTVCVTVCATNCLNTGCLTGCVTNCPNCNP